MKYTLLLLLAILLLGCKKEYSPEIQPYVDYLKHSEIQSAKDYVLSLFEDHDMVIICERDHWEMTQYDLFIEIAKDAAFTNNVGYIFTEVGTVSAQNKINKFVKHKYASDSLQKADAVEINRNLSFAPFWNRYNYYYFMLELNKINHNIQEGKKINLLPVDVPFPGWEKITNAEEYKNWESNVLYVNRDSIMAQNIINKISEIRTQQHKQPKCLVIMNMAHAYNRDMAYTYFENPESSNVGRYLFEKYPNKVANIFMNTLVKRYPPDTTKLYQKNDGYFPISKGKWDAAFLNSKIENAGFDFANTPFGKDYFDHFQFSDHTFNYQDIFTGLVYYQRPGNFIDVSGIPNSMENNFDKEYIRRLKILYQAKGISYDSAKLANRLNEKYSVDTFQFDEYKNTKLLIDRWLK